MTDVEEQPAPTTPPPKRRRTEPPLTPPKLSPPDPPGMWPHRHLLLRLWQALEAARRYEAPPASEDEDSDSTLVLGS